MSSKLSSNIELKNTKEETTFNSLNTVVLPNSPETLTTNKSYLINSDNASSANTNFVQITSDKEKLFKDFLIFQNFMKMQSLLKYNFPIQSNEVGLVNSNNIIHNDKNTFHNLPLMQIDNPIKISITQPNSNDEVKDCYISQEKILDNQVIEKNHLDNQVITNNIGKTLNFDDIPIKLNSQNFIELLEKQLCNENYIKHDQDYQEIKNELLGSKSSNSNNKSNFKKHIKKNKTELKMIPKTKLEIKQEESHQIDKIKDNITFSNISDSCIREIDKKSNKTERKKNLFIKSLDLT